MRPSFHITRRERTERPLVEVLQTVRLWDLKIIYILLRQEIAATKTTINKTRTTDDMGSKKNKEIYINDLGW